MRKLAIVLVSLLILALVIGAVGCGGGGEALSPEAREIHDFLDDKHVNAVLQEERNIFDEWDYAWCLYDGGRDYVPFEDFERLWHIRQALWPRAAANYDAIIAMTPPESLAESWELISEAIGALRDGLSGTGPGPMKIWLLEASGPRKHLEAWGKLNFTCQQHGIPMPWALPSMSGLPHYN